MPNPSLARPTIRYAVLAALIAVAIVLPYVLINAPSVSVLGNNVVLNLGTLSFAMAASVGVLALVVLVGYNGQLALAAGFFMGVGAYLSIILSDRVGLPSVLAAFLSVAVCAGLGTLIGLPALRIRGTYLALVTITLAAVFPALVRLPLLKDYTGGSDGLLLEGQPEAPTWLPIADAPRFLGHIPGIGPFLIGTRPLGISQTGYVWAYFAVLISTVLIFWLVAGVLRGRTGRAIISVRDNEIAAAANGVNVARTKLMAFALSGAVGGAAGCLYTEVYRIVAPDSFGLTLAIYLLFGMILGGPRTMAGAAIGGFAVAYLPAITSQITHLPGVPDRYLNGPTASLTLGLLLIIFPMLMPSGVAAQFARRGGGRRAQSTSGNEPPATPSAGGGDLVDDSVESTAGHVSTLPERRSVVVE